MNQPITRQRISATQMHVFECIVGASLTVLVSVLPTQASPASPHRLRVAQPDGTLVELFIRGDEYFHWYEDNRGFTVVREKGAYYYAAVSAEGQLVSTTLRVGKDDPGTAGLSPGELPPRQVVDQARHAFASRGPQRPDPSAARPTGTLKNVVILLRFANHVGRVLPSPANVDLLFNAVGGDPTYAPTGSVRDVYLENSYGQLSLDSTIFGWVDLPQSEAYYADGVSGMGPKIWETITDALNAADPLIDFAQFDDDGDGRVDAITFVHSGYGAEWGGVDQEGADSADRIWSHRSVAPTWTSAEGVKVADYHINPSLWSTSGSDIGRIAVICHETGHFLGLPDLYDTSGGGEGIGSYCLMANSWGWDGSQHYPPHFSAWCKQQLGWVTPANIGPGTYAAAQVESSPTVYRVSAEFPSGEYLLVENRQPVGFESIMPQGGLCIWHIDEAKADNTDEGYPGQPGWPTNNMHYRVALLQADGNYDLELGNNRGDAGDVYHAGGVSAITQATTPNTHRYQSGIYRPTCNKIEEIGLAGPSMNFKLSCFLDCNGNGVNDADDIASGTSNDCQLNGIPDECEPTCNADINGDSAVNVFDLASLTDCLRDVSDNPACDVNCDGVVSTHDHADVVCEIRGNGPDCCSQPYAACCPSAASLKAISPCWYVHSQEDCELMPGMSLGEDSICSLGPCDCNGNGVPDACDTVCVGACVVPGCGSSPDCDGNLVPDECQSPAPNSVGACCTGTATNPQCATTSEASCLNMGGVWAGGCTRCTRQNTIAFGERDGTVFIHEVFPPFDCAAILPRPPSRAGCPAGGLTDAWVSPAGPVMCYSFGAQVEPVIPADYFGSGSDAFAGAVCLEGDPLGDSRFPEADTLIQRSEDPFDLCDAPSGMTSQVEIAVAALSLRSVEPMVVLYNGGQDPEEWDVFVDLSAVLAPPGTLTAVKTHCNGGTFTSVLPVQPRFTFRKTSDPGIIRVLDTGLEGEDPAVLVQLDPVPWVARLGPTMPLWTDGCSDFHPGVDEVYKRTACDCDGNLREDACELALGEATDCNFTGTLDGCDIAAGLSQDVNENSAPDECEVVPLAPESEPDGVHMNRFVAIVVTPGLADPQTALRVTLTTLNHPRLCCTSEAGTSCSATTCAVDAHCASVPGGHQTCAHQEEAGTPSYAAMEGKVRYVNSFAFPDPDGSLDCGDDGPPFDTSYKCATLGCEPEYRDWASDLAAPSPGQPQIPGLLYITGDAILPSSTLEIAHLAAGCSASTTANSCVAASAPAILRTANWGDITGPAFSPPDGKSDVLDIPPIVNKLKTVSPIFPEPRLWLKQRDPAPSTDAITVIELSDAVDAGPQGKPYPASRTIDTCPHD